jgi:hypothetical protein
VLKRSRRMRLRRGLGNSNYYRVILEHDYAEVKEMPRTLQGNCMKEHHRRATNPRI